MKSAEKPRELDAEQVCFRCDVGKLGISSSAGLEPRSVVGDRRGEEGARRTSVGQAGALLASQLA